MGPDAGADYITSPYIIVHFKVQPSNSMTTNVPPIIQKWNKNHERENEGGGRKGWELNFCLRIDLLMSMGNFMPETTSTPLRNVALSPIKRTKMRSSLVVRASDCQCTSCNGLRGGR
jgi:hypothetical protein